MHEDQVVIIKPTGSRTVKVNREVVLLPGTSRDKESECLLLGVAAGREMWGLGKEKAWKKSLLGRLEAELLRRSGPLLPKWWAIGRPGHRGLFRK